MTKLYYVEESDGYHVLDSIGIFSTLKKAMSSCEKREGNKIRTWDTSLGCWKSTNSAFLFIITEHILDND